MTTNPRKLKIKIDVKENQAAQRKKGEFQYSHSVARVGTGDEITWFSNDGETSVRGLYAAGDEHPGGMYPKHKAP